MHYIHLQPKPTRTPSLSPTCTSLRKTAPCLAGSLAAPSADFVLHARSVGGVERGPHRRRGRAGQEGAASCRSSRQAGCPSRPGMSCYILAHPTRSGAARWLRFPLCSQRPLLWVCGGGTQTTEAAGLGPYKGAIGVSSSLSTGSRGLDAAQSRRLSQKRKENASQCRGPATGGWHFDWLRYG